MAQATISLRLRLHAPSDPISGTLDDDDGNTHAFHGWIGLAAALQSRIDASELGQPAAPAHGEINGFDTPHHDPGEHRQ